MYDGAKTRVRMVEGDFEHFQVEMGFCTKDQFLARSDLPW